MGDEVLNASTDVAAFTDRLLGTVDAKIAEILSNKPESERTLNYFDATTVSTSLRSIFRTATGLVPNQVEMVCSMTEAILAPSAQERKTLIKAAVGAGGGAAGAAMIVGGIGAALGWGAGAVAAVVAFFVGTRPTAPSRA